ncbi:flagella basal body P-ring formation protein FlgA [Paenarthrobacter sp. Z7-10]|uniref:RcpC/CpaB family pilus assembly protein n=1 Tax=Paenarthrobacter sp. Z7-10 TaxID=2787635 RepID=UPI0022A917B5|nr:RcpC/CpaB family pilus assembly protein [Paenarthrobacter sp. Z7-10]MCZ2404348.1 flagella basal body P-ring formation protein FlgA [Paenarthrobacter sp. Z7-10]
MKRFGKQSARALPAGYRSTGSAPSLMRRVRRLLGRRRRLIAALLFCAATAVAVQQLTPEPVSMTAVLVAARDLAAGATVTRADVALQRLPQAAIPATAYRSAAEVVGHRLAGPLRKRQLITDASLLGPGLLSGAPPGSQAVPLRLADPSTLQLIRPGQLVTVVLSSSNGLEQSGVDEVLATAVPVLWKPPDEGGDSALLPGKEADGLLVVAANPAQAVKLAGASARGKVFLVLTNGP